MTRHRTGLTPPSAWRTLGSALTALLWLLSLLWLSGPAFGADATAIADAAMRGDAQSVRQLLHDGADPNAAQGDGLSALHWAARHGDVELVRMLLYAGAHVEAGTRLGRYTPLHLASQASHAAVVTALLGGGADVEAATTSGGARPLHFAAAAADRATIAALLAGGADPDSREQAWGQTPLMFAASSANLEAIAILLEARADVAIATKVVDVREREKAEEAARKLREKKAAALRKVEEEAAAKKDEPAEPGEPGEPSEPSQEQPPGEAASSPEPEASAAPSAPAVPATPATPSEPAATTAAAASGEVAALGEPPVPVEPPVLEEPPAPAEPAASSEAAASAEPVAPTEPAPSTETAASEADELERPAPEPPTYGDLVGGHGGLTALLYATREGHAEAVDVLLDAGADINQVSAGDHTSPLLIATLNGHFDLAMHLLHRGADPNIASDAGATPLHAALNVRWAPKASYPQQNAYKQQRTTYLDLMTALLEAGADPNARLTRHLWYMSYNFDHLVDMTGATAFWRAAYATDLEAMRLLVARGADPSIATSKLPPRKRGQNVQDEEKETEDLSGVPPVEVGGPALYPIHAAAGAGYGERFSAHAHQHVPDAWLSTVRYLVEELGADPNVRDEKAYTPLHHAASRGDNEMVLYLVYHGADVQVLSRKGQTTADMANGPVQRVQPFLETIALLEFLGSKNNQKCLSC